jgi:hypothetical protein
MEVDVETDAGCTAEGVVRAFNDGSGAVRENEADDDDDNVLKSSSDAVLFKTEFTDDEDEVAEPVAAVDTGTGNTRLSFTAVGNSDHKLHCCSRQGVHP